jgi:RNA polymerase sigma-70 factor (ECF subfamily)
MSVPEHRSGSSGGVTETRPSDLDQESFEQWYVRVWPRLVRFVRAQAGGDAADATEVAAEAMARAYERWDAGTLQDPTPWVYTVGLNLLRRRARRRALERHVLDRLRSWPAAAEAWTPDVDLVQAIAVLPPRQRTAIYLRYVADLTQAEVAQVLGIAPGSAASLLHAARTNLEHRLGPVSDGGDHAHR